MDSPKSECYHFKELVDGETIACGRLGYPMLSTVPEASHGIRICVIAMVAVVVLFTPMQSAGANGFSHPHTMLQLIAEALHLTPDHRHAHAEASSAADTTEKVVLRADHPDNHHVGDHGIADTNRADPPVLTKVSLTMLAYVPALLPSLLSTLYPVWLYAVLPVASDASLAGRTIQPDLPPPRHHHLGTSTQSG